MHWLFLMRTSFVHCGFKRLHTNTLKEKSSKNEHYVLCSAIKICNPKRVHCIVLFYNLMHYHTSLDGYYYSHAVKRNTMNDNNRIIWIISIKNIFLIKPLFYVLTCRSFLVHFIWKEHLGLYHDLPWPFDLQKIF